MTIKLVVLGVLLTLAGNWLQGHDVLTAVSLMLLFLLVVAKIVFAVISHRRSLPPTSGGQSSSGRPVSRPPPGGPTPVLSAVEERPEPAS